MSRLTRSLKLITETNPKSPISEAYRILRTNLEFSNVDEDIQTIMVTSTSPGEGKSTTSANLAVAFAQSGKRVLLIDADMRKPTQHHMFNLSNRIGLTTALAGQGDLLSSVQKTATNNLSFLSAGPTPPNPSEILASKKMTAIIEEAKRQFDLVIIDTPPVMVVADAGIVASKCDGVVLVVDSGKIKRDLVVKSKQSLEFVGAKILGVVLNNMKRKGGEGYYYYYYGEAENK